MLQANQGAWGGKFGGHLQPGVCTAHYQQHQSMTPPHLLSGNNAQSWPQDSRVQTCADGADSRHSSRTQTLQDSLCLGDPAKPESGPGAWGSRTFLELSAHNRILHKGLSKLTHRHLETELVYDQTLVWYTSFSLVTVYQRPAHGSPQ